MDGGREPRKGSPCATTFQGKMLRNPRTYLNLAVQVLMKVCLSREEDRTYIFKHIFTLIYNF